MLYKFAWFPQVLHKKTFAWFSQPAKSVKLSCGKSCKLTLTRKHSLSHTRKQRRSTSTSFSLSFFLSRYFSMTLFMRSAEAEVSHTRSRIVGSTFDFTTNLFVFVSGREEVSDSILIIHKYFFFFKLFWIFLFYKLRSSWFFQKCLFLN